MERPLKKRKISELEASDQTGFTSLPTEIIFKILDDYPVPEISDLISLALSCSFFYNIFRQYWKDRYYREYNDSDELSSKTAPTHQIKLFLWSFLPADYETNNNGIDWCISYKRRFIMTRLCFELSKLVHCVRSLGERSGWKALEPTDDNNYHKYLAKDTFRFGFLFDRESIFGLLREVPANNGNLANAQDLWLKRLLNLPAIVDLKSALDLCFLHLTFDAFTADPTATLISVTDPFHFNKAYNPHIAHAHHLCSLSVSPPDPTLQVGEENHEEPVIMDGENIEYAEYGLRRWGFYTNCYSEGLLWGDQLNELLETKYRSEWLLDPTVFKPCNYINNFNDLKQ